MANSTAKINQTAARALELGNAASPHGGFTGDWDKSLRPATGIAYSELSLDKEFSTEDDGQITYGAQPTADVLQAITMENSYNFVNRFRSKDQDFAWSFGFETIKRVVVATLTDPDSIPSVDKYDEYTIDGEAGYEFLRFEKFRLTDYSWSVLAVFLAPTTVNIVDPITGATTLVGDGANIVVKHIFPTMAEHLYELPNDRSLRPFTEAEESAMALTPAEITAEWQRSLMMRFLKKYSDYIIESKHNMCESFNLSYSSGQPVSFEAGTVGFNDEDMLHGEEVEASFELACEDRESALNINFYQTMFEIAPDETLGTIQGQASYDGYDQSFEEGVTDMTIGISIPLQKIQDTVSGLYINEPQIEGKYEFEGTTTITYNKGTKYRRLRDAQAYCHSRVSSYRGAEMQELLIKKFRLRQAGPNMDDVAAEPIEMNISGSCGEHPFTEWLTYEDGVNPEVYESAIVMRCRNFNFNYSLINKTVV
jgi:hypothetical protein